MDLVSHLPPWLLGVEYMTVRVRVLSLSTRALNMFIDLCKDFYQSKTTKYVIFIETILMTLGGVRIISILITGMLP